MQLVPIFFRAEPINTNGAHQRWIAADSLVPRRLIVLLWVFCPKYSWWRLLTFRLGFHRYFASPQSLCTITSFHALTSFLLSVPANHAFFHQTFTILFIWIHWSCCRPKIIPQVTFVILWGSQTIVGVVIHQSVGFRVSYGIKKNSEPKREPHLSHLFWILFFSQVRIFNFASTHRPNPTTLPMPSGPPYGRHWPSVRLRTGSVRWRLGCSRGQGHQPTARQPTGNLFPLSRIPPDLHEFTRVWWSCGAVWSATWRVFGVQLCLEATDSLVRRDFLTLVFVFMNSKLSCSGSGIFILFFSTISIFGFNGTKPIIRC